MKKTISVLLLICTLIFCLVACDKHDKQYDSSDETTVEKTPEEKVSDLIYAIFDVDSCFEAAKAYNKLSANEKKNVLFSTRLEDCMEQYANDTRVRDCLMEYRAQELSNERHDYYRKQLINISSYTVNSQSTTVFYDDETDTYFLDIRIDYSAQNQMGGYKRTSTRDTYVWRYNGWCIMQYQYDASEALVISKSINEYLYSVYCTYNFKFSID